MIIRLQPDSPHSPIASAVSTYGNAVRTAQCPCPKFGEQVAGHVSRRGQGKIQNLNYESISEIMGITVPYLYLLIHKSVLKLRHLMADIKSP